MTIPVEYKYEYPEDVDVLVDGECLHKNVDIELRDFGKAVYRDGELDFEEDERPVLSCHKCGAWRYNEDDEWAGVTVMPMIYYKNSGKVVLR